MGHDTSSVLIIGETGVGKEVIAEYIHRTSDRSQNPLIKVSLSSLPADLMASELFGHEQGSFTSAHRQKKGLFEAANTGTLFLDDIDDVPLEIQTKLLRVLESHELMHVGGTKNIPINIRLLTATKVDLRELIRKNLFRDDLYFRINVIPIEIPPLRDRREDVPLLINHFLKTFSPNGIIKTTKEAMAACVNYHWPGNVRELRNIVQRVALFCNKEIKLSDLPPEISKESPIVQIVHACNLCFINDHYQFNQIIHCIESNLLKEALGQTNGNQSKAAKNIGLSLSTFRDKLRKYANKPSC